MAAATMVKLEPSGEDDESWLYGATDGNSQKATDPKTATSTEANAESRLSAEAAVFEPRRKSESAEPPPAENRPATSEAAANQANADDGADTENADEDDSEDDDVQVTIGDIKSQPFDASVPKFKTPYQQQHSQGSMTASKPPAKGIDLDAVGTVSGVPVYEFDMENIKMEDKPWRKPGADITDYFNYGFNEDTWTKYCEKQRRLRIENNSHKSGNLIFVHGSASHRPEPAKSVDSVNSGEMNSYSNSSSLRKMNNHQPMHKISSTIDVIGSTTRDSRRPQPQDFADPAGSQPEYQQISSVTTMLPMSMSVPPPILNMPPPDFGMPPPPGSLPPGAMAPPPHMGPPPPGLIAPPPMLVGPPPGFGPPSMGGPPFDPYFRGGPGGPPPPHDRRPPPGFPDRPPPFGFDGPYGPPPFGAPPGAPPSWDSRPVDNYNNMDRGGGSGGGGGGASSSNDRAPPSWDFRGGSPARSDTDFSSSAGDDHERRASPSRKHRGREVFEHQEKRESRQRERSRSRDRSRLRDSDRDHGKDADRDRSRESRDRGRDSERDRGRESTRGRDSERDRERSRDRDRHRGRSSRDRDRKDSYDRDRRHHKDKEDRHHSRRREEDEDRHKSKHKKEKKVKKEPMDDEDDAPGTPTQSDENTKA